MAKVAPVYSLCVHHCSVVMSFDEAVLSEGFELVQVVSQSQKFVMAQMLIQMNWWLFGSSTLVTLMLLRHKENAMSAILKYNTLAGNKNLVLCEKFSQQCTVKHSSMSANVFHLST
jgi:hypothetical protein